MFYVYILGSRKNGRLYTGHTTNIDKRLEEHNNGLSKSTKNREPFELIYKEEYQTRGEAIIRERYFKTGKGREEIKKLQTNKTVMFSAANSNPIDASGFIRI